MLLRKFPAWPVLLSCLVSMPVLLLAAVEPNTVAAYLQAAKEAGRKPNRLITQSSPYLLQHAYNPVNWYAWGDEAFQRAKKENKPVFLSIGYSTCHWCHVMAHESFENKKIADYLNKHFIAIKVDREERPDIDSVYMAATRLIHGSGGWPMTVFVDHQRRPFHAATYYPPFTTGQHPGLYEVLEKINLLWRRQPARLDAVAASITASIKQQAEVTRDHERVRKDIQQRAMQQIALLYDDEYGGFSAAPKFPTPGIFAYLNKRAGMDDTAAKTASDMMKTTLDAISRGGMYDQLGGGFHRYSVDAMWRLPHFEKMLYSQALMTQAYLGFYSMRPVARYREMVLETLAFVQREMRSPQGGFYAALDADSERIDQTPSQLAEQSPRQSAGQSPEPQAGVETRNKAEGAYYLWTEAQLKKTLTKPEFDFVRDYFETRPAGNIASDPRGEFAHANLLAIAEDYRDRPLKGSEKALLQSAKVKLGTDRLQRPRPHLDDKIITAWNAMMAVSFVQAANLFAEHRSDFIRQAEKTIDFIFVQLYDHRRGRLYRQSRRGTASVEAMLNDYAWLIKACLAIHTATAEEKWLARAVALEKVQDSLFLDADSGAYFASAAGDSSLLFRTRSIVDGALPAANAIVAANLKQLASRVDDRTAARAYEEKAGRIRQAFAAVINERPSATAMLLSLWL